MLVNLLEDCISKWMEEILENKDCAAIIDNMKEQLNDEDVQNLYRYAVRLCVSQAAFHHLNEEESIQLVKDILGDTKNNIMTLKSSYIFVVKLRGLSKYVEREIEIPCFFNLLEFCYAILASMNCDGGHLFSVDYDGETYYCNQYGGGYDTEFAGDYSLKELELKKKDKLTVRYDFGEDYVFSVVLKDVVEYDHVLDPEDMRVIKGKGMGIWEDNHDLLELYYKDREAFDEMVEIENVGDNWIPIEEEIDFNIDNVKNDFYSDYYILRTIYEDL